MSDVKRVPLPPAGATFDELCGFVGGIASVCSGRNLDDEGKVRVGKTCLGDAAGGIPSKPWEYVPTVRETRDWEYTDNVRKLMAGMAGMGEPTHYGDTDWGRYVENRILEAYYKPEDFYVFKCRAINLVWYQLSTHRVNSPLKESLRYLPLSHETEYEFPPVEDCSHRYVADAPITARYLNEMADAITPMTLSEILKNVYKRKEIQSRDHNAFKLVNFYLCGTKEAFENMFNERSRNTKCQKETREFVQMIEDIVTA